MPVAPQDASRGFYDSRFPIPDDAPNAPHPRRARVRAAFFAAADRARGPLVRAAFFAIADRCAADRRRAVVRACFERARLDAVECDSRRKALLTARDRRFDTERFARDRPTLVSRAA